MWFRLVTLKQEPDQVFVGNVELIRLVTLKQEQN